MDNLFNSLENSSKFLFQTLGHLGHPKPLGHSQIFSSQILHYALNLRNKSYGYIVKRGITPGLRKTTTKEPPKIVSPLIIHSSTGTGTDRTL